MNMANAYKELYLSVVDWGRRTHGSRDLPELNALLGLVSLGTINVFSMIMAIEFALGTKHLIAKPRAVALLIWLVLLVIHYAALVPAARRDNTSSGVRRSVWIALAYAVVSVGVFLCFISARAPVA
jgi:hypothetical protein